MGRGASVIANDVPEHREVLGDAGRTTLGTTPQTWGACSPNSWLDAPGRAALGTAAAERAKTQFSWDHVTDDYVTLFTRMLARRG